jgi:hypothetical protein
MNVSAVLSKVLSNYASFALIFLSYRWGHSTGQEWGSQKWKNYCAVAFQIGVFCLFLALTYGTHWEPDSAWDPTDVGGGEVVQDFTPTSKQRNEYGLEHLLTFEIAALFGVYKRNKMGDGSGQ